MSISTAKEKSASERFMLVRLTPARDVSASLSSEGSGVYTMTFPYPVAKVERNGTELTKVTTVSNNDEYSFDEDSQSFQVKLASAPDSDDNIVVVYYHLFYTGGKSRLAPADPESEESASNILREWEPRLESYPNTRQSVKNGLVGVLTVDDMQLRLVNTDHRFENYLTGQDSFSNKDVVVWLCIDSIDNIQVAYTGKVSRLRMSNGTVDLNTFSPTTKLNAAAYMGDTPDECFTDSASTNSAHANRAIPFIIGSYSQHKISEQWVNELVTGVTPVWGSMVTPPMLEAFCTSYDNETSTSSNRTWTLCRTDSNGVRAAESSTITGSGSASLPFTGSNFQMEFFINDPTETYYPGDTVRINSSPTVYGLVSFHPDGNLGPTDILVSFHPSIGSTTYDVGDTITRVSDVAITIKDNNGKLWFPCDVKDFNTTITDTSGGNKLIEVTFVNNFEANYPDMGTLSPDTHTVYYMVRTSTDTDWKHGSVIQKLCEAAGLTVDTDSIDAANLALSTESLFCIPQQDETEPRTYLEYLEAITGDMVSVLTTNANGEVVYKILEAPDTGEVADSTTVARGSVDVDVDFNDIITTIVLENPNIYTRRRRNDSLWSTDDVLTNTSNQAKFLHEKESTYTNRKCTAANLSDVSDRILNLRKNRSVTYQLSTATQHIDAQVGDDLTLETPDALGGSGTTNLKIISIDKSTDKTTIEATDLKGL